MLTTILLTIQHHPENLNLQGIPKRESIHSNKPCHVVQKRRNSKDINLQGIKKKSLFFRINSPAQKQRNPEELNLRGF